MKEPSPYGDRASALPDAPFRVLVDAVRDYAIFLLDPTGHVMSWNAGAERLKGYTEAEIKRKHFSIFYDPEDVRAGKCERKLEEATQTGRAEDEAWRLRKDGSRFWANVVITALRDDAGKLLGFTKVTRDLTERRAAEEQRLELAKVEEANRLKDELLAREREARLAVEEARSALATTLRSIGDAVIATDTSSRVTLMNPVAERLTGWKLGEARGRPLRSIFHVVNEQTRREVESPVDRVLREGVVVGLANHTILVARDGTERPIADSGAPIRDDAGTLRGVVLVFRDAGQEARESARRMFLAEAMAMLASSLDYRETLARAAEILVPRWADWCLVDVLEEESSVPICVGAAHVDPLRVGLVKELGMRHRRGSDESSALMRVIRTGRAEAYRVGDRVSLADWAEDEERARLLRDLRTSSALIVPLLAGRRVLGAMTLAYAESGRTYDADDLAFAEEFGQRAGVACENARLFAAEQRARDMADTASRMKDEFLATVSHELRTPLSAILGWSRMLSLPDIAEEKRARGVETIERNARLMTKLIEDLLDVSRIVSGKMRIELESVDLASVVSVALDSVRPTAAVKGVEIVEELDRSVPPVSGDAERLQQVVWNLLTNAVKFTPRGGRVEVRVRQRKSHAEIVVRDTGNGIDPRFLPHVFDPFRQADASIRRTSGGLGLGLAIVKHLVEQHGGHVDAQSEGRERGATFTVCLPLRGGIARGARRDGPPPLSQATQVDMPRLDGVHVLLVEDDADTREMLVEALSSCGARVTPAGSAGEAMEAFARAIPDVLVSDIGMPDETGIDLIRRVRDLPVEKGGRVPAAALTAYTRQDDRRAALGAGFDVHVSKPVDAGELAATVAALLRFREGRGVHD